MTRSAVSCAVCQRPRTGRSHVDGSDVFICTDCEADARQFIEIQDSVWVDVGDEGDSTAETDAPAALTVPLGAASADVSSE